MGKHTRNKFDPNARQRTSLPLDGGSFWLSKTSVSPVFSSFDPGRQHLVFFLRDEKDRERQRRCQTVGVALNFTSVVENAQIFSLVGASKDYMSEFLLSAELRVRSSLQWGTESRFWQLSALIGAPRLRSARQAGTAAAAAGVTAGSLPLFFLPLLKQLLIWRLSNVAQESHATSFLDT